MSARRSLRAARLEVARLRTALAFLDAVQAQSLAALADAARREQYQALLSRAIRNSHAISTPGPCTPN